MDWEGYWLYILEAFTLGEGALVPFFYEDWGVGELEGFFFGARRFRGRR